jgi:hypothetical protein|tara:strand:+ start:601 stop:1179 length:579 start_codon:yes stop_codon:yes gene_type:complete
MTKKVNESNFIKAFDAKMNVYVAKLSKEFLSVANKGKPKSMGKIYTVLDTSTRSYGFTVYQEEAVTRYRIPGQGKTKSGKQKYTMGEKAFDRSKMEGKLTKPWKSSIRQHKRKMGSGKVVNVRAHVKTYTFPFKPILIGGTGTNWKVVHINDQVDIQQPIKEVDWVQDAWTSVYNKQGKFEKKMLQEELGSG